MKCCVCHTDGFSTPCHITTFQFEPTNLTNIIFHLGYNTNKWTLCSWVKLWCIRPQNISISLTFVTSTSFFCLVLLSATKSSNEYFEYDFRLDRLVRIPLLPYSHGYTGPVVLIVPSTCTAVTFKIKPFLGDRHKRKCKRSRLKLDNWKDMLIYI